MQTVLLLSMLLFCPPRDVVNDKNEHDPRLSYLAEGLRGGSHNLLVVTHFAPIFKPSGKLCFYLLQHASMVLFQICIFPYTE